MKKATLYWIDRFLQDEEYGKKRFKRLLGMPPFDIRENLMDFVSPEEFIAFEEDRLPFFIGSQFGIIPRMNEIPNFFNGSKVIAILGKSLLSGHVSGLKLYQIEEGDEAFKYKVIRHFQNEPLP